MRLQIVAVLLASAFAVSPAIAAAPGAASGKSKAAKVRLIVSPEAQKILDRHGASLKDGILRWRGSKTTYDIATGSGTLRVIADPKVPEALTIGAYDRGRRYAALRAEFPLPSMLRTQVALTPVSDEEAAKLFPAKE